MKTVQAVSNYSFIYTSSCGGKQCQDSQDDPRGAGGKGGTWLWCREKLLISHCLCWAHRKDPSAPSSSIWRTGTAQLVFPRDDLPVGFGTWPCELYPQRGRVGCPACLQQDLAGGWDSCRRPEGGTADTALERSHRLWPEQGIWGKCCRNEALSGGIRGREAGSERA